MAVISCMQGAWWDSSIGATSTFASLGAVFSSCATRSSVLASWNSSKGACGAPLRISFSRLAEVFMLVVPEDCFL